jgi:hypothetical protein
VAVRCRRTSALLYVGLLEHAAADVESRGPCLDVLAGHENDDQRSIAAALHGSMHRLVLEGGRRSSRAYAGNGVDAWPPFRAAVPTTPPSCARAWSR